ncbi:MAG TPA: enoyl-CoA hydratase/isomerase family protein [Vicinamibacterales bacterium]
MIDLVRRGRLGLLEIRHGKANAIDVEFCEALRVRLEEARNPDVAGLVIVGEGRMFSAGVDLLRVIDGGAAYVRVFLPAFRRVFETLFDYPKPVVAAVNGHAIAGGCVLACAADHRVMASGTARIGVPELLVGVAFPTVAFETVRNACSGPLRDLIFTGRTLLPEEARAEGLVDAVVAPDALLEGALKAAEALADRPQKAFVLTKRQFRADAMARIAANRETVDREVEDLWCADGTLRTIRAYVERTLKK